MQNRPMALLAAFIGIDRFKDPSIREFAGCKRGALALWSLFSDTIPRISARLLLDHEAAVAQDSQSVAEVAPNGSRVRYTRSFPSPSHFAPIETHDPSKDLCQSPVVSPPQPPSRMDRGRPRPAPPCDGQLHGPTAGDMDHRHSVVD